MDLIKLSKDIMRQQTEKNKAPAWLLTKLAVRKGKELAKKYGVDEKLVVSSLYLAHTVFSPVWKGEIQKKHSKLSAEFVRPFLEKWGVSEEDKSIILNAIEAHGGEMPVETKVAEIVKNAECFKFVTVHGSLIWLHECGIRGYPFDEAVDKVLEKMEQKRSLLTLPDCIKEAERNSKEIISLFTF